jgi:nitronate monooxygenase
MGADAAKAAMLRADETQTIHTHIFDIVQRLPWPDEFPGRALQNAFTARWHGREAALQADLDAVRERFEAARRRDDYSEIYVYAGQVVALVHEIPSAGELVARLAAEAEEYVRRATNLTAGG